jgi:hypothetical protein
MPSKRRHLPARLYDVTNQKKITRCHNPDKTGVLQAGSALTRLACASGVPGFVLSCLRLF